ncbi:hypothetical protein TRVA0_032S00826 [Trichomonascus vanleenenianus]|uniref:Alb1 domain-containing protein n=1 Tax=Trichomonascus vanleenenianus TaxID=2268995 RepID=UPI003ECA8005
MAKKQTSRSRTERRKAEQELLESYAPAPAAEEALDGKTRVQFKKAELAVRGIVDDEVEQVEEKKRRKNPVMVPNVGNKVGKSNAKKSHKQKKRQVDAIERALNLKDQMVRKVEDAKARFATVKERRKPWEQLDAAKPEEAKIKKKQELANIYSALEETA